MNANNETKALGKPRATPKRRSATIIDSVTAPTSKAMVSGFGTKATDNAGATPQNLTTISFDGIRALIDKPIHQGIPKSEAQWVIPSMHQTRKQEAQREHGRYVMLWADIDNPVHTIAQMGEIMSAIVEGCDYEIYASSSAKEDYQKCRILVPLSAELTPQQWLISQELLNAKLSANSIEPDTANVRLWQVMYLPNIGEYYTKANNRNGDLFQPLKDWAGDIAQRNEELAQREAELKQANEAALQARQSLKASQVGEGADSLIHAFNAAYDVAGILLQAGYSQRGHTFRHPNSQTGSYSASMAKDGRVHTLSSADPLYTGGNGGHDAFSVFEVLVHNGNQNKALIDAGDNLLSIGDESWNRVKQRKYMQNKNKTESRIDFDALLSSKSKSAGAVVIPECDDDGVINGYVAGTTFPPLGDNPYLNNEAANDDVKLPPKIGFEFVPIGDLLKAPVPVEYLVDGLIEHPSMGLVFGPHSCGKSFITLSMAACVATGTPWMDRPTTQGAVFYLAGEGHAGLSRRLMGWSIHSGIPLDNAPLFISKIPAQIMDTESATDVTSAIEVMSKHYGVKPALIVIDTFARNMGSGDENSNSDVGLFISHIDKMRVHTGATVLLVHHSGHNVEAQERARGASAMGAAMDCIFQLSKEGDHITITPRKAKEEDIPPPIALKLAHPVKLPSHWMDAAGRVMSTAVAVPSDGPAPKTERLTPAIKLALDTYYRAACESGEWPKDADVVRVRLEDWQPVFYEKSTAENQDAKRMAFKRARNDLNVRGLVTVQNDVYIMQAGDRGLQMAKLVHVQTQSKD
jgi:hypothetical protein